MEASKTMSGTFTMEEKLDRVADAIASVYQHTIQSEDRLVNLEIDASAVLRRELLPLLLAGQAMRFFTPNKRLAEAWDAALGGSEGSDGK